ncbi:MBL fold metallo-hydrolase [bacterium]|nr:MBL fold metallo-hydrolase [bacterium]
MKFRFLGTGAGNPHPSRMTSSTLIEGSNGSLLLDAGEGCSQRLVEPDRWSQEVRSIVITHRHVDHHSGLPMLLSGYKGAQRRTPLEIHVHPDLMEPLRTWIDTLKQGDQHQPFELSWVPLQEGTFRPASGHDGFIWKNDHLAPDDLGGCHSLALNVAGDRWVFSGDIGSFASIEPYLDDTKGLIVESRHADPEESVTRAHKRGVKHIILTHVARDLTPFPIEGARWAEDNLVVDTNEFA